jgi:prolyl oligopeptidase
LAAQTDILHLKSDVADTIFGQIVPDPYRWMEDLNSDSVKQWLSAQRKITHKEKLKFRQSLDLAENNLDLYAAYNVPAAQKVGPWYFSMGSYLSTSMAVHSPVLFYRKEFEDKQEIAYNPNEIMDKYIYSIAGWSLSDDGQYLAVSLSKSGSDWCEIRVRNLRNFKNLNDKIDHVRFSSLVWWKDGFFYACYKKTAGDPGKMEVLPGQQLYYHKLGDSQEQDKLIIAVSSEVNEILHFSKAGGHYLVVTRPQKISGKWYNTLAYKDLEKGLMGEWKLVASSLLETKVDFNVIGISDSNLFVRTNLTAPHYRILSYNLNTLNHADNIVPEKEEILQQVSFIHHELVARYFNLGRYTMIMYNLKGDMVDGIKFNDGISVSGFEGMPDDSETIYYESSFYTPQVSYKYDFKQSSISLTGFTHISYQPDNYATHIVFFHSADGTRIPMYLTYRTDLRITGNNPVLLYGYGGFGTPMVPSFHYSNILFLDNNGILAVPMIRGGGEMGGKWHEDGAGLKKQNSFDDFIAAAEFLEDSGYTTRDKLAIEGGSNGGLLIGAMLTQRPDLFHVAIGNAGLFDMVRFNKFTGGRYWTGEYGSPDDSLQFKNLYSYSPLHHVKPGVSYPAALFITGRYDDRVPPFQTYKFLATLQNQNEGSNPHILYFEDDTGHHGDLDYYNKNYLDAFILAFIFTEMNLPLSFK